MNQDLPLELLLLYQAEWPGCRAAAPDDRGDVARVKVFDLGIPRLGDG
jgi:hypothetical protein